MGVNKVSVVEKDIFQVIKKNPEFIKLLSDEGYLSLECELVRPITDILYFLLTENWCDDSWLTNGRDPEINMRDYDYDHLSDTWEEDPNDSYITKYHNVFRLGSHYYTSFYVHQSYNGVDHSYIIDNFKEVKPRVKSASDFEDV